MATVKLENVTKTYQNGTKAVSELSFNVFDREFLVLVGPSGCGKTTILRLIAGLEIPTSGKIIINDVTVNSLSPKERNIAMVFQDYALYPHMTVFENISFGLILRGYTSSEIKKRVEEAADLLGIRHLLKRRPYHLSGGEQQRVALGRAIVRKPDVFLFDEPLSNIDARLRAQMRLEIKKLHIKLQTTVIYVTHDQLEAMTLGDRLGVVKDGKLLQISDSQTIYEKPANKFVAEFIGTPPMNIIEGKISKEKNRWFFKSPAFRLSLINEQVNKLETYLNSDIILGIRPEHIHDKIFVSNVLMENVITATCEAVENIGSDAYLRLFVKGSAFVAKFRSHTYPAINDDIEVVFDISKAHFFDKYSGNIIL